MPLRIVQLDGRLVGQYEVPRYFALGWHDGSAGLGVPGNSVFGGHSDVFGQVFRYLSRVRIGDEIVVYGGGQPFTYRVTQRVILKEAGQPLSVRIANAHWIDVTGDERLTLVTCWPYPGNSHRLIVVARPAPARSPEAAKSPTPSP